MCFAAAALSMSLMAFLPIATLVLLSSAAAECRQEVYVPYARHLLSQDKFDEARLAYVKVSHHAVQDTWIAVIMMC
jgi:hypothetical protein